MPFRLSHLRRLQSPVCALALLLGPSLARAEDRYPVCNRTPSDADVAAAKGAFQAGKASFDEGDYPRSIVYWEDAYRRDCTAHLLLLNVARAYELNNQKQKALAALETYVARNPDSPDRASIDRRIARLQGEVSADSGMKPDHSEQHPTKEHEEEGGGIRTQDPYETSDGEAPPSSEAGAGASMDETVPESELPPERKGSRPVFPLVLAGAGGAIGIVGGVLYAMARADLADFEKKCPVQNGQPKCPNDAVTQEANSKRTETVATGVVTVGGALALVGGLVWYFASEPRETQARSVPHDPIRPWLAPEVGKGYAGLSVQGSF